MEKTPKEQRIEKIKFLIASVGLPNINKSELARQFGVSPAQITYDIQDILKNKGRREDIDFLISKFNTGFDYAFKEAMKLIDRAETIKEKSKAISVFVETATSYLKHLRQLGYDVHVPDMKIDIELFKKYLREDKTFLKKKKKDEPKEENIIVKVE